VTNRVRRLKHVLVGAAALLFVFFMRPVLAWLALVVLAIYSLVVMGTSVRRGVKVSAIAALLGVVAIVGVATYQLGRGVFDASNAIGFVQDRYLANEAFLNRFDEGRSHYSGSMLSKNPYDVWSLTVSLLRGFFVPNPLWVLTVPSFDTAVMFLPGIAWYLVNPWWVLGVFLIMRARGQAAPVWLLSVGVFVAGSTGIAAAFEPVRARVPVLPLMYLLAAYAIQSYSIPAVRSRAHLVLLAYAVLVVGLESHYLLSIAGIDPVAIWAVVLAAVLLAVLVPKTARMLRASG
jgi:hypothetical protein